MHRTLTAGFIISCILMGYGCSGNTNEEKAAAEALLLKNYRPESIYNMPQTRVEKAAYPAVDMHAHLYPDGKAGIERWVKTMDEVGIEQTVVMTYATGARFDSLHALYSRFGNHFVLFCGFDYTGYEEPGWAEKAVKELERLHKVGAAGIGELGDKGKGLFYSKPAAAWGMHIDDPRMDPLLEKAGELGMPVNVHVAEPKWMYERMDSTNDGLMNAVTWRLDNQEGIKSHAEMMQTLDNAVSKHPNTTFIAAHLANASYDLSILGRMLDQYPNLYADIGARYAETAQIPRNVAKFITKYQDRLYTGRIWEQTRRCTVLHFVSWKRKTNTFMSMTASATTGA